MSAALAARRGNGRPTALVASEDVTACRLVRALRGQGLRVPEDVSVAGFDGRIVEGEEDIRLTTWQVPWYELGRTAMRVLVDSIERESDATQTLIGGKLLVRETTCAPREEASKEIVASG